jgi:DNA-directed RNA polymerase subunit M/transcription elongation factor TFIIS
MKLDQNVLDVDRCPKCGDDDLVLKYWEADDGFDEPEHIDINCGRCRYRWKVACADAKQITIAA